MELGAELRAAGSRLKHESGLENTTSVTPMRTEGRAGLDNARILGNEPRALGEREGQRACRFKRAEEVGRGLLGGGTNTPPR